MDALGRKDGPELEAAFNLLRKIYWREYGRGWREAIAKIRNIAADEGLRDGDGEIRIDPACSGCAGITHSHTCDDPAKQPKA